MFFNQNKDTYDFRYKHKELHKNEVKYQVAGKRRSLIQDYIQNTLRQQIHNQEGNPALFIAEPKHEEEHTLDQSLM